MATLKSSNTDYMFNQPIPDNFGFKFCDNFKYTKRMVWAEYYQESPYHNPEYLLVFQWVYGVFRKTKVYSITRSEYISILRYLANSRKQHGSYCTRGSWVNGVPPKRKDNFYLQPMPINGMAQFHLDIKL